MDTGFAFIGRAEAARQKNGAYRLASGFSRAYARKPFFLITKVSIFVFDNKTLHFFFLKEKHALAIQLNEKDFFAELMATFKQNGLSSLLTKEKAEKLFHLTQRLLTENEKYNLTAITEPKKVILHHYADCATLCAYLPKGAKLCDVGCGAGFPTLPLAILREDLKILAIDATGKRVDYVKDTAQMLSLGGVSTLCARAEDAGKDASLRECFDFAVARAVAQMRILAELCLPLLKVSGKMIAMKGKNARYELADAKKALSILGARENAVVDITLKNDEEELCHPLIILDKTARTPAVYPRPYAQISKKPL